MKNNPSFHKVSAIFAVSLILLSLALACLSSCSATSSATAYGNQRVLNGSCAAYN